MRFTKRFVYFDNKHRLAKFRKCPQCGYLKAYWIHIETNSIRYYCPKCESSFVIIHPDVK